MPVYVRVYSLRKIHLFFHKANVVNFFYLRLATQCNIVSSPLRILLLLRKELITFRLYREILCMTCISYDFIVIINEQVMGSVCSAQSITKTKKKKLIRLVRFNCYDRYELLNVIQFIQKKKGIRQGERPDIMNNRGVRWGIPCIHTSHIYPWHVVIVCSI